jgi:hypothetical protein
MSDADRIEGGTSEPWLATLLRTSVYVVTAAVLAFPLAVPEGVLGALLGAGAGAIAGRLLAGSALRLHVIVLGALGALALAYAVAEGFVGSESVAETVGPSVALRLGDFLAFFGFVGAASVALRAASVRHRALAVFEASRSRASSCRTATARSTGRTQSPIRSSSAAETRRSPSS